MGYLLKEALKTLCGVNQWSYAVFWKIGSQNAKILIWEECYHGPITYSGLPHISAIENPELVLDEWEACWVSAEARASQSGVDARDRVHMLVNKMMVEGHFNVVGEGLVGRAAFTGNHQWILSENYTREAQPPKVINELCQHISSGMQTVVVIPVLPHGVVQFGSSLSIMENMGFVNDVKTMVHQLGCIPGVLLSENYAINEASPTIPVPICPGKAVSVDLSGRSKVTASNTFVADSCSQQSNSSQPLSLVGQTSYSLNRQNQNNPLYTGGTGSTFRNPDTDQILSNAFLMSQQKGLGGQILSASNPSSLLNPHRLAHNNASMPRFTQSGLQMADSSRTETSTSDFADHLPTPAGDISTQIELDEGKELVENDIFQALRFPWSQPDEQIPGFLHDIESPSGNDLFDIVGMEYKNKPFNGGWGNFVNNGSDTNTKNPGKHSGGSIKQYQDSRSDIYSVNEGTSDSGIFSVTNSGHLLDAVVSRVHSTPKQSSEDNASCRTTLTNISNSSAPIASLSYNASNQRELYGLPTSLTKVGALGSCSVRSGSYKEDAGKNSPSNSICGSQISSWVEQGRNGSVSTAFSKRPDEVGKSNRKRLKPGEKPRPRPKDRQMIQDRVKELREIVPNGAKCSIDSLLERTIKHMLFLQSVTKHADKLKQMGESKIISKEGGQLLKDNFEGGATWAYEVGSQSMVCPIIVEDLNSPRQMLVEMLCEERGLFLEIADIIRGLGLTILRGVMETRNDKIWARFTVEANRDVTRMEIFMSLAHLLEQTVKNSATSASNCIDNDEMMVHQSFHQVASIPATGMPF